jgi:hypothetical protein
MHAFVCACMLDNALLALSLCVCVFVCMCVYIHTHKKHNPPLLCQFIVADVFVSILNWERKCQ